MRAGQVEKGRIVNIIEVASLDAFPGLVDATGVNIGDAWVNGGPVAPLPFPIPPQSVPMLNAHLVLISTGKMKLLVDLIGELPDADRFEAQAYLNLAQTCKRDNKWVVQLGAALGYDPAGLDQLFIQAAALNP
jgi:hypothetical protein